MAIKNNHHHHILIATLTILLVSTVISARPGVPFHPCNTLIISTFSFSLPTTTNTNNNNHDQLFFSLRPLRNHHHRFFRPHLSNLEADKTTYFPDLPLRSFHPIPINLPNDFSDVFHPRMIPHSVKVEKNEMTDLPLGFSSMRDRTKDILSVVASLLFGAACGALTAGTMYLVWSIVNYRGNYRSIDGFESETDSDDDDIFNPKKSHYVAIPVDVGSVKEKVVDAPDTALVAKDTA